MVSEVVNEFADDKLDFFSSGTDTASSTRISLCHSGFKGVAVSSV